MLVTNNERMAKIGKLTPTRIGVKNKNRLRLRSFAIFDERLAIFTI
jgi:hypothetical protein